MSFGRMKITPDPNGETAPCKCLHSAKEHKDCKCMTCAWCSEYRPQYPGTFKYEYLEEPQISIAVGGVFKFENAGMFENYDNKECSCSKSLKFKVVRDPETVEPHLFRPKWGGCWAVCNVSSARLAKLQCRNPPRDNYLTCKMHSDHERLARSAASRRKSV